jgi:hypothetical protein
MAEAPPVQHAVHIYPAKLVTWLSPGTMFRGTAEPRQRCHLQSHPLRLHLTATERGCPQPAPNGKV